MTPSLLYVAFAPVYTHPYQKVTAFPMIKYDLIPGQLLHEGTITNTNIVAHCM